MIKYRSVKMHMEMWNVWATLTTYLAALLIAQIILFLMITLDLRC